MAKQTNKPDVICRVRKKDRGFTIVDNRAVDDLSISIEAVGVYNVFKRWSTFEAPDFTCSRSFIQSKSRCADKKFERIWKELKEHGYIKMYYDGYTWAAELLEDPEPDTPHTYYLNAKGEVKRSIGGTQNTEKSEENDEDLSPPPNGGDCPDDDLSPPHLSGDSMSGDSASGDSMSGGLKQGDNINTPVKHSYSKNSFNNHSLNNQSINPTTEEDNKRVPKKLEDRLIDSELIERVKKQIDYDINVRNNPFDVETIDLIVSALCELHVRSTPKTFGEVLYSAEAIRDRADMFNSLHVEYILECMETVVNKPNNIKAYMLATVFSAPMTYGAWEERNHAAYIADPVTNGNNYSYSDPDPSPYAGAKDDILNGWGLDPTIYGDLAKAGIR